MWTKERNSNSIKMSWMTREQTRLAEIEAAEEVEQPQDVEDEAEARDCVAVAAEVISRRAVTS